MENHRLISVLGHEPHTPLDEAVEATLAGMGCLERSGRSPVEKAIDERPERRLGMVTVGVVEKEPRKSR